MGLGLKVWVLFEECLLTKILDMANPCVCMGSGLIIILIPHVRTLLNSLPTQSHRVVMDSNISGHSFSVVFIQLLGYCAAATADPRVILYYQSTNKLNVSYCNRSISPTSSLPFTSSSKSSSDSP